MCQAFYMIATYDLFDYRYKADVVKEDLEAFSTNYLALWY